MTYKRTDQNQTEVVEALRAIGASVAITSMVGFGFGDLVVGYRRNNKIIELKFKRGTWTPAELEFHQNWQGKIDVARSIDEAIAIVTGQDN
jgi:hypothetical protein